MLHHLESPWTFVVVAAAVYGVIGFEAYLVRWPSLFTVLVGMALVVGGLLLTTRWILGVLSEED